MSHPLVVEAIEDLFVPLLVYNNKESDAHTLKHFSEPSWNNPVVRFLKSDGSDVIPRKDNVWTTAGVVDRTIKALQTANRKTPRYLQLIGNNKSDEIQIAEFAMHCYWEGEAKLGSIPGVLATRSGWRGDLEVVEIQYDDSVLDYAELLNEAKKFECASKVFTHNETQRKLAVQKVGKETVSVTDTMRDAKLSDQKYYVRQTSAIHLPLTELQATKINAALGTKKPWRHLLSPRQTKLLRQIDALVESDKAALTEFNFPTDPNELVNYSKKLSEKLNR